MQSVTTIEFLCVLLVVTVRIWRMGKVMFSVCLSVHTWGVSHLHHILFPLVPCPFQRLSKDRGTYPDQYRTGVLPGQDTTGILSPARTGLGYPPARTWQDCWYPLPPDQDRTEVPHLGEATARAVRLLQFPAVGLSCLFLFSKKVYIACINTGIYTTVNIREGYFVTKNALGI